MLVVKIDNHVEAALGRLLQQYKGKVGIEGFATAIVKQIQDLEDGLYPVNSGRQIFDGVSTPAIGVQLDGIGKLVGISRNGLSDEQYILVIFGKIAENFSDDTVKAVLSVIGYLFQPEKILVSEIYPAGIYISVLNPAIPVGFFPLAVNLVQNALGAGIKLVITSQDTVNVFRFAGSGVTAANGFGSIYNPGSGGVFVGLI